MITIFDGVKIRASSSRSVIEVSKVGQKVFFSKKNFFSSPSFRFFQSSLSTTWWKNSTTAYDSIIAAWPGQQQLEQFLLNFWSLHSRHPYFLALISFFSSLSKKNPQSHAFFQKTKNQSRKITVWYFQQTFDDSQDSLSLKSSQVAIRTSARPNISLFLRLNSVNPNFYTT